MSRMSRKCTVSADSSSAKPSVRISCTSDRRPGTTRARRRSAAAGSRSGSRRGSAARGRSGPCSPGRVTIGRISAGNRTFLIRLPPEIRTPADSFSDEENQVHGRMPQNMNSAYGSIRLSCAAGITYGEDERVDQQQQQRVDERPEEPEDRPAVARLQLARHQALDQAAVARQLREVMKHRPRGRAR